MSRRSAGVVLGALIGLAVMGPAFAVTDRWAAWDPISGSANDFSTTMRQQAPGFPVASVSTDSRSSVQLAGGVSTFLGAGTPPGAKYGSSSGNPYLVLRPRADNAAAPSTTTYTFDSPTPDTGWAFVLGDVDSDQVRVTATDASGGAVPAVEVASWFRGPFNYAGGADLPLWDAATTTLTGNAGAVDTDGASGWFEPDVRLTSVTFTFTRRAGFPVYQTWFVSRARPVGGIVSDASVVGGCPLGQVTMTLLSPTGAVLASTSPGAGGAYTFGEVATQAGYTVRLDAPGSCAVLGPAERAVSNRGNDNSPASRADFTVRAVVPQPISGTVRDDTGGPVAGVVVTLSRPAGGPATTTTGPDGTYLFDDNALGTGYTVSISVPSGYTAASPTQITGIDVAAAPVTDQDFALRDLPSVSGTVTAGGDGAGGVQVVLTPVGGGTPVSVATRGDGSYVIDDLPPGDYTLEVVAPPGYTAPPARTVTVPVGGLTGQDLALSRPGALGGSVAYDGAPAGAVQVVVEGPGGTQVLTTDAEGQYFLDQLATGTWTITVRVPDGAVAVGPTTRSVVITAAGEVRGGQDFTLTATPPTPTPSPTATPTATPTTTPSPTPGPTAGPSTSPTAGPTSSPAPGGDDGDTGGLPDTGGPGAGWVVVGAGLLLGGLALLVARARRAGA